mmetsp:Transcript_4795/g.12026  ORF Transcript_4795/g.12026 Transcript_4795/m.12026 type:complete len:284 (+) Transcript_4795:335-1186(+)
MLGRAQRPVRKTLEHVADDYDQRVGRGGGRIDPLGARRACGAEWAQLQPRRRLVHHSEALKVRVRTNSHVAAGTGSRSSRCHHRPALTGFFKRRRQRRVAVGADLRRVPQQSHGGARVLGSVLAKAVFRKPEALSEGAEQALRDDSHRVVERAKAQFKLGQLVTWPDIGAHGGVAVRTANAQLSANVVGLDGRAGSQLVGGFFARPSPAASPLVSRDVVAPLRLGGQREELARECVRLRDALGGKHVPGDAQREEARRVRCRAPKRLERARAGGKRRPGQEIL